MAQPITFSPSSLSTFRESPREFYLEKNHGLKKPRGIFSAMPGAIDLIIKSRYDWHRAGGTMPAELADLAASGAVLFEDQERLLKYRNWRSAPVFVDDESGARLSGMLDDAIVIDGKISSLDVKTTKARDDLMGYSLRYYQLGQSCYGLMLDADHAAKRLKIPPADVAVLAFYMPAPVEHDGDAVMRWTTEAVVMPLNRALALDVLRAAVACLAGPLPATGPNKDWESYYLAYAKAVAA